MPYCCYCGGIYGKTVRLCSDCSDKIYTCPNCGKRFELVEKLHCDDCNDNYCYYYRCVKSDCHMDTCKSKRF